MKLSEEALLEIVAIFHKGLAEMKDVSQMLRDLDLVEDPIDGKLLLSAVYKEATRG